MACSSCQKKKNKNKQPSPIVTPINNLTPEGRIVTPNNNLQPSEKFQTIRVLPPKRG